MIGLYSICTFNVFGQDIQTLASKHSEIITHVFNNNSFETERSIEELFDIIGNSTIPVMGKKAKRSSIDLYKETNKLNATEVVQSQTRRLVDQKIISSKASSFLRAANEKLSSAAELNGTFEQNMSTIQSWVKNLISDANSTFNVHSIEGELIFGYLYLVEDSANFWDEVGSGSGTGGEIQALKWPKFKGLIGKLKGLAGRTLPQLDAVGYLWGWGNAALEDYLNDNLEAEGQWDRIREGIKTGAETSAFEFLGG